MTSGVPAEVRLGNDIARQFAHLDDRFAADAIAGHIRKFWDPRMRAELRACVAAGETGIDPLLALAAQSI